MADDPEAELREHFRVWLATQRPRGRGKGVLSTAEHRLIGSIKRDESPNKQAAFAERLRSAWLGYYKSWLQELQLPTNVDDPERDEAISNAQAERQHWEAIGVDEIIAIYAKRGWAAVGKKT